MRVHRARFARMHGCWMLIALLLAGVGTVRAQADVDQPAADDPPARVARLAYASGDLGLLPAGSADWSVADVNRPLTHGDKLSGGPDARAELELGGASLRISGQTDVGILNLDEQVGQFELTQGTLSITVRSLDQGATYEIDTPTLALVINQPGTFRIDVDTNGNTASVTAFSGGAMVYGENNAQREIFSGRSYQFADASLNDPTVTDLEGRDAFDAWCSDRDARYANDASAQYVSQDVVGAQDLNQYGDWQVDADYGAVWYPANVAAGWAPYRFGHWTWVGPWGWTWVDALPWGFAPYHYGRWVSVHGRWGWIPSPPRVRPIYAPALVAFVGMGSGGPVGWFPLGPHEVYNPWYRASRRYYTNVNLTNIMFVRSYNRAALMNKIHHQYDFYRSGRPITGVAYANRNLPHAFTAVPALAFASARNVQRNQVHLEPQSWRDAPVVVATPLRRPSSASFGRPLANARPAAATAFNRPVVAVRAPNMAGVPLHGGRPVPNVRVLGVHPENAPRIVTGHSAFRPPAPSPSQPARATQRPMAPRTLPQVPQIEPARQIHPVEQAPRYASPQSLRPAPQPSRQPYLPQEQRYQNVERARFEAAQRAHEFVPQRQYTQPQRQPSPSHQPMPYRFQPPAQPIARPGMGQPAPQAPHPQNFPRPHAPPPGRNEQH